MPANRSRTERWRDCLQQIHERGGGLEFSVRRPGMDPQNLAEPGSGTDLVWRVRILGLTDREIIVERPSAMGQPINLGEGVDLVAVMSVGQNRWMFATRTLPPMGPAPTPSLRLAMPEEVERCRRREFYRASTAELSLPRVVCWPLLDPTSAVAAEVANRAHILDLESGRTPTGAATDAESGLLPHVAPPFHATMVNIGGGGLGLQVPKEDSSAVERARFVWMRVNLSPQIPAPLGITAKIVHTHRDSSQDVYVGAAFDFSFHPQYKDFVVKQISRYVAMLLEGQRKAA